MSSWTSKESKATEEKASPSRVSLCTLTCLMQRKEDCRLLPKAKYSSLVLLNRHSHPGGAVLSSISEDQGSLWIRPSHITNEGQNLVSIPGYQMLKYIYSHLPPWLIKTISRHKRWLLKNVMNLHTRALSFRRERHPLLLGPSLTLMLKGWCTRCSLHEI